MVKLERYRYRYVTFLERVPPIGRPLEKHYEVMRV